MYRFLFTPRWLGILGLTIAAAAVMVMLGNWQFDRYQERAATNDRIKAATAAPPVPLTEVLPRAGDAPGVAGPPPVRDREWTSVMVTGRYDAANVILVRGRTVNGRVGFEVLTPLVLADGSAVLVDRGWVPPAPGGATARPDVPAVPSGVVTVTGHLRRPESHAGEVTRADNLLESRRIAVPHIARELPYPVYGGYVLLDEQEPPADSAFTAVPIGYENNWQNGGYAVQWWLFAVMAFVGFGWAARREARQVRKPGGPAVDRVSTDRASEPDRVPATDHAVETDQARSG